MQKQIIVLVGVVILIGAWFLFETQKGGVVER
jgi:hypothetical protein